MSQGCEGRGRGARLIAAAALVVALLPAAAGADTLEWALVQAYQNNPVINSQRAAVRVTDETVPTALSGYRPRVSLSASIGEQYLDTLSRTSGAGVSPATYNYASGNIA